MKCKSDILSTEDCRSTIESDDEWCRALGIILRRMLQSEVSRMSCRLTALSLPVETVGQNCFSIPYDLQKDDVLLVMNGEVLEPGASYDIENGFLYWIGSSRRLLVECGARILTEDDCHILLNDLLTPNDVLTLYYVKSQNRNYLCKESRGRLMTEAMSHLIKE